MEKHKIIHIPKEDLNSIAEELENQFLDVVKNDGSGDRASIGECLAAKLREDGIII